ncbi:hypothetical protein [Hymenobacter negativus]|uniref:Uncharacterized protein n=1 Tax=Hymenobacter negativus TaxID=2795026 RepID=A0ABS3QEW1_9BACT|nr:hypothetical protein [Hymenobacter negativus]MBO2009791.1 hypothetical protein [Hymenobacter negativus]
MISRLLLAALLSLCAADRAMAQGAALADSLAAKSPVSFYDNDIKGYGKAEIVGPDGKTHFVYIPLNLNGFASMLSFYRQPAEIERFGAVPFSIDVDKVQSIRLNGQYYEHIILKGKRKHILARRLTKGPVELLCYNEVRERMTKDGTPLGWSTRTVPYWYLRRPGQELVAVDRVEFIAQTTRYFRDYHDLLVALTKSKLRYHDMLQIVEAYNEYLTRPVAADAAGPK